MVDHAVTLVHTLVRGAGWGPHQAARILAAAVGGACFAAGDDTATRRAVAIMALDELAAALGELDPQAVPEELGWTLELAERRSS